MRKGRFVFFALASVVAVSSMVAHVDDDAQPIPAEQAYKNIQILKGTPADQIIPSMQFITSSLGVHCDHCHIEGAFEKDDKKPKVQARAMMKMVATINHDSFADTQKITCYTCHQGRLRPRRTPKISDELAKNNSTPVAESVGAATEIVDNYLKAVGGTAALSKIASVEARGVMQLGGGISFPLQILLKQPGMRSMVVHFPNGDSIEVVHGNEGWSQQPGRPLHTMSKEEASALRLGGDPNFIADLRKSFGTIEVRKEKDIHGKKVIGVRASNSNAPPIRLYFDEQSGLLVRLVRYVQTPLGRNPTQIDYSDYREVAGTKQPFHLIVSQPQGSYSVQLQQMNVNVPINDSRFAKPATAPGM